MMLVIPLTVVMTELPLPGVSVTTLLLTGLPFASLRVTVIVEEEVPSASTGVGLATTVDVPAVTPPATKVTVAVPMVMLSVVSLAV